MCTNECTITEGGEQEGGFRVGTSLNLGVRREGSCKKAVRDGKNTWVEKN